MATKITIIINNPTTPEEFEPRYERIVALADQLPDLQRLESAKVWPKEDHSETPAYRTLDLYFSSYEIASAAVQNAIAGELFQTLVATGTRFTALFSDIEQR